MCIVIIETDVEILRLWEEMAASDEMDHSDDGILDQFEVIIS